jgi:hypothetical protein
MREGEVVVVSKKCQFNFGKRVKFSRYENTFMSKLHGHR